MLSVLQFATLTFIYCASTCAALLCSNRMSNTESNKISKSPAVEGANCENCFNPRCGRGNIAMQGVQIGCPSNTKVIAKSGAIIKVELGETSTGQKQAKNSRKRTRNDMKEMKEKLQCEYRRLHLPVVPWMQGTNLSLEQYYIPLSLTSKYHTALHEMEDTALQNNTNKKYELENIFDAVQGNQPKRILVESQPGFGKTTLVHKIVHDWVLQKDYIRHFELAVLIVLKYLHDQSLRDAVIEELGMEGCDEEVVWNMVNNANTLLLLDGLDEIGESAKKNILKKLNDTYNNRMTIITTCRTGLFKLEIEERDNLFKGKALNDEFWDTRVTILGLTGENRQRLLDKFIEDNVEKKKILERVNHAIAPMEATFDSPLLLILLVFITQENPKYKSSRRTELFKNLVDCMVKRSVGEIEWRDLGENFSLFSKGTQNHYRDIVSNFGKISVANILADDLQFEHNGLLDDIFKMGFLKKHETRYKLRCKVFYECFHLTLLEFAAAYSLWDEFEKNANKFPRAAINKINEIRLKKGATCMVLPFLCGLMGQDVQQFFRQFTDFCALYSVESMLMDSIFSECDLSENSYTEVAKFVPKVYFCSNLSLTILANQNYVKFIRSLVITFGDLWRVAKNHCVMVRSITLLIEDVTDILSELTNSVQFKHIVKCNNLIIDMTCGPKTHDQLAVQMKILFSISTEYRLLFVSGKSRMNVINECVKNNVFKHRKVDYLECVSGKWDQEYVDKIINVINSNAVKELVLIKSNFTIHDEQSLGALISVVASTRDLNSIKICNSSGKIVQLDISVFATNGKKCWSHLSVNEVNLTRNVPVSNLNVSSLEILGGQIEVNVKILKSLTPTQLRLGYDLFQLTMIKHKLNSRAGLASVENLALFLGGQTAPLDMLADLHRLKNLKRLQLCVSGDLSQEQQSEIVGCLSEVAVDQLQLCWNDNASSSAITLITALKDLIEKGELKLVKNIDFMLEIVTEHALLVDPSSDGNCDGLLVKQSSSCFLALISAVKCDHKVTAHVMFGSLGINVAEFNTLIDFSQVSVEQVIKAVDLPYARNDFLKYAIMPHYIILKIQKKICDC